MFGNVAFLIALLAALHPTPESSIEIVGEGESAYVRMSCAQAAELTAKLVTRRLLVEQYKQAYQGCLDDQEQVDLAHLDDLAAAELACSQLCEEKIKKAGQTPWWVWPAVGLVFSLAFVGGYFVGDL